MKNLMGIEICEGMDPEFVVEHAEVMEKVCLLKRVPVNIPLFVLDYKDMKFYVTLLDDFRRRKNIQTETIRLEKDPVNKQNMIKDMRDNKFV